MCHARVSGHLWASLPKPLPVCQPPALLTPTYYLKLYCTMLVWGRMGACPGYRGSVEQCLTPGTCCLTRSPQCCCSPHTTQASKSLDPVPPPPNEPFSSLANTAHERSSLLVRDRREPRGGSARTEAPVSSAYSYVPRTELDLEPSHSCLGWA